MENMDNPEMFICTVCFRQFVSSEISSSETVEKVFTVCSNYLRPEIFKKSWDDLLPEEKNFPFCQDCFSSGEKLSIMYQKLQLLQKEIENFVEYFSTEIQQYCAINNQRETTTEMKYEIPLEHVIVKEEEDFEDMLPSPVSSILGEYAVDKEEDKEEGKEKWARHLRKVIIPLKRLQFDSKGNMIAESMERTKRNTLSFSNDSEDAFSPDEENSYSEFDSSDEPNEPNSKSIPKKGRKRIKREGNECEKCGKIFAQKQSLREHLVRKHFINGVIFDCEFCGFEFKVKKELRRHMKRHSGPFSCGECGETFNEKEERFFGSNQHDYEIHLMKHNEEIPFSCQLCQQIFSNSKNYTRHQKFGCPASPTPFNCSSCEQAFKAEYLLFLHELDHRVDSKADIDHCALCQKGFSAVKGKFRHRKLEAHYLTAHSQEFPFTCDICGMPLRKTGDFNNHRLTHKPKTYLVTEQKLDCPHCDRKFNRKESLREHIIKKHDTTAETFSCEVCLKEFKVRKEFNQHVKQHSTTLFCPLCPKTFSRVGNLNLHLKLHSGDFTCTECQKNFPSQHSLQLHRDTVHLNYKRFLCHLCGKGFSTRYKQQTHLKTHSTKSQFRCDVCGETFMREFSFNEHMRLHTGKPPDSSEFPFICDVCGKLFRTESSVKQHQKSNHDDKEKLETETLTCEECGKTFKQKKGLQEHRKRKHDVNAEIFECPVENCAAKFKIRKELHVHIKRHTSCIPCGICERTFRCAAQVKVHRRVHTGELFECSNCDKRFISASRLNNHVSSVHLKEKHYFCEVCGKGFFKRDSYQLHLSIHSDEKLFECKECGEKFNTDHKRKDHRRKMHTNEIFDCHICAKTFLRKATLKLHIKKHK